MSWEIQKPGIVNRAETLEREVSYYAVCSTAAGTAAKTVSVDPFFRLETGSKVCVRFSNTNTASTPTLNVNGTGAYQIRYRNASGTSGYLQEYVAAGRTYDLVFDGSYWQIVGDVDTILSISDSTSSSSSTTAASSAAVKNLADLISALTSRVSELESELSGGGFPMMPTSSTVSPLYRRRDTQERSEATAATSSALAAPSGDSFAGYNYVFSTPPNGTWVYFLSYATCGRTGRTTGGTIYYGVASGNTDVATIAGGWGWSETTESGGFEEQVDVFTTMNMCWRIS